MKWVLDLLQSLVDTIVNMANFVVNTFQGLFEMIALLPSLVETLTAGIGLMPSFLAVFATLSVTILVVYFAIDRNAGG